MTSILKKQLMLVWGTMTLGAILLWNGNEIRAQSAKKEIADSRYTLALKLPRTKLTSEQAVRNFIRLLQLFKRAPYSGIFPDSPMLSSFSRKSDMETLVALYPEMARQWMLPSQNVQVQNEGDRTATAVVETKPSSFKTFVLVKENGGWCVDMVATYAKWNGLEGTAKTEAIARLTSAIALRREKERRSSCQTNLETIAYSMAEYARDYDVKLPARGAWTNDLKLYFGSRSLITCPSVPEFKGYGYAYNLNLDRKPLKMLSNPSTTVSVYETTLLRHNAYGTGENRAFRHFSGAIYGFADGHSKWFDKSKVLNFNPNNKS